MIEIVLIIVGFALLIFGADLLVDGASGIAKKFHISEIIIGLTIVSIGTSLPELFVSVTSALKGFSDISLGNVIGSNLCNLLLILGTSAMLEPIVIMKQTAKYEVPFNLFVTVLLWWFCITGDVIDRVESIILLTLFAVFIGYTFFMSKKLPEEGEEKEDTTKIKRTVVNIILIILGIVGLKFGGELTVNNAVSIATRLGLSEKLIGITILAVGTSLPELVTSIIAVIKHNNDIAIGNIIGSNVFNILLILGVSSIIKPISYNVSYNSDLMFLIGITLLFALFPLIPPKNKMSRLNGAMNFVIYIGYILALAVNAIATM